MREQAGLVVSTHGRHCMVENAAGHTVLCHVRGKRLDAVVGDRVHWLASHDRGVVTEILPRRNLLRRQDRNRSKLFAANLDQVLVMLAARPVFAEMLLARMLIACAAENTAVQIILNKADLRDAFDTTWQRLLPYHRMGYAILPLAAADEGHDDALACLRRELAGKTSLLVGPSGVGKSTLINRLVPDANTRTAEISQALQSGRHTTTRTDWYWLDRGDGSAIIDSPGFQEFGLQHLDRRLLARYMPDLAPYTTQCRFANCTHMHEPGCQLRAAVGAEATGVHQARYDIYGKLWMELAPAKY